MPPEVSVIIPVYNDPEGLRDTLESLLTQEFEHEYEVLPVDNNSTDSTGDVIEEFEEEFPEIVRGLEESEVQSSYAARNTGIRNSKSDVLAFIDSDMWVEEDYISKIHSLFQEKNINYAGCNVHLVQTADTLISKYNYVTGFQIERIIRDQNYVPTCGLICRRKVFEEVGFFRHDIISGGDKEFGKRVYEAGYEQVFAENIDVYHPTRNSLGSFIKKHKRIGKGDAQLEKNGETSSLGRSWYDIRNFLPARPREFMKMFEDSPENVKKTDILAFYFIYYILKVTRSYERAKYILSIR